MNSQQYTGLQAAMPQGSGARVAINKGEGAIFDTTAAVKSIQEVGNTVANHIQKTQDANRQIDYTLMQSQNAIKDKEAQQVLQTLDPETRKVTLPDGTQQDHKAYVDAYSQAKNQTVNDFRGEYNYGHYQNDKIDVATRSVLETSAVENQFIKQQNDLQIAEGRTINATKKLISSMDIPADQALTETENALKATQMPYTQQRQVLADSAKTRVTLELSNQSLQTSKDLGELVKKYGGNKDTYDKKVQEYYSSEAYQHRVNSLLALQTYLENNPDLAGTAAETKLKIQQQEVNTLNEANVAVQGDKAALHASLLTQALQDSQATSALALINPDSPVLSTNYARLSQMYKSPTTTQEYKAKVQREIQDVMEYQKVGRDITNAGNVLNYTYKGSNANVALKVEEMKISAQKEMERLAEKAAKDAERYQDRRSNYLLRLQGSPTLTPRLIADGAELGLTLQDIKYESGKSEHTDDTISKMLTQKGFGSTLVTEPDGSPQQEHIVDVFSSTQRIGVPEQRALKALSPNRSDIVTNFEAYAQYSQQIKSNAALQQEKKKFVTEMSQATTGSTVTGLYTSETYDLAAALTLANRGAAGIDFRDQKAKDDFIIETKNTAIGLQKQVATQAAKDKQLGITVANNLQAKVIFPRIAFSNVSYDAGINQYTDMQAQPTVVVAAVNVMSKTAQALGASLTMSSGTRTHYPKGTNHDLRSIKNGMVALDFTAGSSPNSTGMQRAAENRKITSTFYSMMSAGTKLGTGTVIRGGGSDFYRLNSLATYVKQHGTLPPPQTGGKGVYQGYESMSKAQQAQLTIWLKNGRFESEGAAAQNHLHFECNVNPKKIYDNLPKSTQDFFKAKSGGSN